MSKQRVLLHQDKCQHEGQDLESTRKCDIHEESPWSDDPKRLHQDLWAYLEQRKSAARYQPKAHADFDDLTRTQPEELSHDRESSQHHQLPFHGQRMWKTTLSSTPPNGYILHSRYLTRCKCFSNKK